MLCHRMFQRCFRRIVPQHDQERNLPGRLSREEVREDARRRRLACARVAEQNSPVEAPGELEHGQIRAFPFLS
jgi:hypothetical protein